MADPAIHGPRHARARAEWAERLATAGQMDCTSPWCKTPHIPITPADPWDLGHAVNRQDYAGPQHPPCNRATRAHQAALRTRPTEPHPGQIGA